MLDECFKAVKTIHVQAFLGTLALFIRQNTIERFTFNGAVCSVLKVKVYVNLEYNN